ncbi:50S ribosomal protein L15 [Candidatus Saccharibacteria bacterium]|nr:50S ribosomal protein L15 [Candidatus Saccharibacteria bacterium]
MKYNDLIVEKNARPSRKGRGISAGQGKTAGRGTKGQKARTGHRKMPAGFMGGQRAIMQAVPKLKGFKSLSSKAEVVYTDRLNDLSGDVDNAKLYEAGLISTPYAKVKVITRGELTAKINLATQFASKSAISAIKKAGGKFSKVAVPTRSVQEDSRKGDKKAKAEK